MKEPNEDPNENYHPRIESKAFQNAWQMEINFPPQNQTKRSKSNENNETKIVIVRFVYLSIHATSKRLERQTVWHLQEDVTIYIVLLSEYGEGRVSDPSIKVSSPSAAELLCGFN